MQRVKDGMDTYMNMYLRNSIRNIGQNTILKEENNTKSEQNVEKREFSHIIGENIN